MASKLLISNNLCGSIAHYPAAVGSRVVYPGAGIGTLRLPTDPIGTFTLILTNVVVGSTLRVEAQSTGATLYDGVAATSSPSITLLCYASGSPLNALRIKVRKGTSAPFYQPYETLDTAIVGSRSIFVSQVLD